MEQNYDGLKLKNQLCFPLYACSRHMIRLYKPFLDKLDLTYTQYIAMMVFWEQKMINVKELGKKLYLDSGTLTPVLKSLEAKGYVRRYRSTQDERVLLVEITEAGEALKEQAKDIPSSVAACVGLSKEDATQLYQQLYRILDALSSK